MGAAAGPKIALFTTYTSDYQAGPLCSRVNQAYATRHGYGWVEAVGDPSRRRATGHDPPARHPTWDKVSLLLELLDGLLAGASPRGLSPATTHLLWIDADAVVLRHERRLEELLDSLPADVELLIGEDLTLACLEAEYAFLDSNQRSGGDAFSCDRPCSAAFPVFASLVFTRCSNTP
mmetsp:Transcript_50081/g.165840  ORF Transcript_50081/g.165840 Transcript_50081/m.165840 type:complete len:177 (-) Transcript_50081:35-565(-)